MNCKDVAWVVSGFAVVSGLTGLATAFAQEHLTLETLPTGQYYYEAIALQTEGYIFLAKAGRSVIGFDRRSRTQPSCFRGIIEGDRILNARQIFPPYRPDSRWNSAQGEFLDLSQYQRVDHTPVAAESGQLQTCLAFFSR